MTTHPHSDRPAESLHWLPLDEIQEDAGQPRQEFPAAEQSALAESIAESGIKIPLLVRLMPDGTYQLTDGARRLWAARAVGLVEVPCVVSQDGGWLAVRHDQLLTNAQRLDLTPLEDAQALYTLWLGCQIQALEAELNDDGATTAQRIAESSTPTQQIAALEARLCILADVPTVAAYLGGGPMQVRVTWQTVACLVYRRLDAATAHTLRVVENLHHKPLHMYDEGVALKLAWLMANARALGQC